MSDPHDPNLEQRIKKLIDDEIRPLQQKVQDLETKVQRLEQEGDNRRRSEAMQPPPRRRV